MMIEDMNFNEIYTQFIEYHELQGRTFPCSEAQFIDRAFDYAKEAYYKNHFHEWYEDVADALCVKGIGPHWNED